MLHRTPYIHHITAPNLNKEPSMLRFNIIKALTIALQGVYTALAAASDLAFNAARASGRTALDAYTAAHDARQDKLRRTAWALRVRAEELDTRADELLDAHADADEEFVVAFAKLREDLS